MQQVEVLSSLPWWLHPTLVSVVSTIVTMTATVVIAIATVVYARLTARMVVTAGKSAEASEHSAKTAQETANLTRAMFDESRRPYFAVSGVEAIDFQDEARACAKVTLKNYGPVPVMFLDSKVETLVDIAGRCYRQEFTPFQAVVLPQEESLLMCGLGEPQLYRPIREGAAVFNVRSAVRYRSLVTSTEYRFDSYHAYNAALHQFEVRDSRMT